MKTYILWWGNSVYNRYNDVRTAVMIYNAVIRDYGPFDDGQLRLIERDGIHQDKQIAVSPTPAVRP